MMENNTTKFIKPTSEQVKNNSRRNIFNIVLVLAITIGYTVFSLWGDWSEVLSVFSNVNLDLRYIILILVLVIGRIMLEGLILFIFVRLYTTNYKYHRGVANGLVGQFMKDITPGVNGGEVAQVRTFMKQGVPVTIGASILVMHFILNQLVLFLFGAFSIFRNLRSFALLPAIPFLGLNLPVWVLSLIGFLLNLFMVFAIFSLSFSKRTHNAIINFSVNLLARFNFVKNEEAVKSKLFAETENFRVELRRLSANWPATALIVFLFIIKLIVVNALPYVSALILDPTLVEMVSFWDSITKTSFLTMITNFIPIPGAAGFAEYFFVVIFEPVFGSGNSFAKAVQLLWRGTSFYFSLIIGGIVTAFYRSRMEDRVEEVSEIATFEEIKNYTFAEREITSTTLYETSQLSIKEIQRVLSGKKKKGKK